MLRASRCFNPALRLIPNRTIWWSFTRATLRVSTNSRWIFIFFSPVPLYKTDFSIAYAPEIPKLSRIMNQSLQYLLSSNNKMPHHAAVKHLNGFSETRKMMDYLTDPSNTDIAVCGVEFSKSFVSKCFIHIIFLNNFFLLFQSL